MEKDYQAVYDLLCDAESKYIFENKILYNETKDPILLENITQRFCAPIEKKRLDFVNKVRELSKTKKIIICGAHSVAEKVCRWIKELNISIDSVFDNDISKQGNDCYGITVRSSYDIDFTNSCVILTQKSSKNIEILTNQIRESSSDCEIVLYKNYIAKDMYEEQYFDELIRFNNGEIFIDAGVLNLNTSIRFSNRCKSMGVSNYKIFAFEPDRESYKNCIEIAMGYPELKHKLELYNYGLYDKKDTLLFHSDAGASKIITHGTADYSIEVVALDDVVEKATYIKMDIEGAELKALEGARQIISTHKPKLAISAYHHKDDLIDLPLYIKSLNSNYKFYYRHYSKGPAETILYAI